MRHDNQSIVIEEARTLAEARTHDKYICIIELALGKAMCYTRLVEKLCGGYSRTR